jgi:Baseplate J-like protein
MKMVIFPMRYQPILPITLDPRNETQLANFTKRRMVIASQGRLTDISPASIPSIIAEGTAFAGAQLLNALNKAPEAWTADWLRTMGFLQIASSPAVVGVVFTRSGDLSRGLVLNQGFRISTNSNVIFKTTQPVDFLPNESIRTAFAVCETEGSIGNVAANTVNRILTSVPNLTVYNPVAAYGGMDGESWAETKARAFSLLRRRNPVSVSDWEDYFRQILGSNIQVLILPGVATPVRNFRSGYSSQPPYFPEQIDLPYDGSAESLIDQLVSYQQRSAITPDSGLQERLVNRLLEATSYNRNTSNHMFVFLRGANNTSFEETTLNRVRELASLVTPVGHDIHIENARAELLDLIIYTESPPEEISPNLVEIFTNRFNNFLLGLPLGSELEYNDIVTIFDRITPITGVTISTNLLTYNDGQPTESRKSLPYRILTNRGVQIPKPEESRIDFFSSNKISPNELYSAWKLNTLSVVYNPQTGQRFGDLLSCRAGSSYKLGLTGEIVITPNDPICSEGGN